MAKFFLIFLSGFLCTTIYASDKLILCTDNWENATNTNGTGAYLDLVKKVYSGKYQIEFIFFPWPRAEQEFFNKKCDGLIGDANINDSSIKPKKPLDQAGLTVFFIKGKNEFKGTESLKTKSFAWPRSFGYDKLVDFKINFSETHDAVMGYQQLEAGRIDFFIDFEADFAVNCKKSKIDCSKIKFTPSGLFIKIFIAFHKDKRGKDLAKRWDDRIVHLIKSGEAQKIFKKYGYIFRP